MLNRTLAPESQAIKNIQVPSPERIILDNKIPVYLINSGTQEVCKIDVVFQAGSYFQPKSLVARFTNLLMSEGTRSRQAYEIAAEIEYYGAYLNSFIQKDVAGFTVSSLNSKLEKVLPVIHEILTEPVFPDDELSLLKQNEKKTFLDDCRKVGMVAMYEFNELVFGKNHPYGKKVHSTDFDEVQRGELQNFHENHYTADRCFIVVSGKLPRCIDVLINRHFGNLKKNEATSANLFTPTAFETENRKSFKEMEGVVQNAIRIGKRTINLNHPDFIRLNIVNTILGGYFGSRLMTNLREDKGYTYGIYSAITSFQLTGLFYITTELASEYCNDALKEIYREIDRLSEEKISDEELTLVKNYLTGNLLRSIDGPFATASLVKMLTEFGLDLNQYIERYLETIQSISSFEVQSIAQKYLTKNDLSEQVAGRAYEKN